MYEVKQYLPPDQIPDGVSCYQSGDGYVASIQTLAGKVDVEPGDWIVYGRHGKFAVKDEEFKRRRSLADTLRAALEWWDQQGRGLTPPDGDGEGWDRYMREQPEPEWVRAARDRGLRGVE